MQESHLIATEMARAINSLVLLSIALGSEAARAKAANSFITFGVPTRNSLTAADVSVVMPSQFLIMVLFHCHRLFLSMVTAALWRHDCQRAH
jgi:hypothetical protein